MHEIRSYHANKLCVRHTQTPSISMPPPSMASPWRGTKKVFCHINFKTGLWLLGNYVCNWGNKRNANLSGRSDSWEVNWAKLGYWDPPPPPITSNVHILALPADRKRSLHTESQKKKYLAVHGGIRGKCNTRRLHHSLKYQYSFYSFTPGEICQ